MQDLVKDVWKAYWNMIKGLTLYQSVILKLSNVFRADCVQLSTLITCAPTPCLTLQCM